MAQRINQYATYLWQELKRVNVYRIQTNDHRIARKLKKRPNAKLCVFGINAPFWVFQIKYHSPSYAITALGNITGQDVEELPEYDVLVSYTLAHMDTRKDIRVSL